MIAERLAKTLDGDVIVPGDPAYDAARAVWNAMVDRRPRLIARCSNVADVRAAVLAARDLNIEIGVRCGGHSVLGLGIPEDGLTIDLTPMGAVRVDPTQKRAWVQGGALLGALDRATQPHGLATTAGNVSHTGVGGLTLGGGMGWLARQYGLSCDNVLSFEMVTADGDVIHASQTENADLYWGLRGGGGNFGIVTEFEFRLHEVPNAALLSTLSFPIEAAGSVLRTWRDLAAEAPRQATFTASLPGDQNVVTVGFVWVGHPATRRPLPSMKPLGRPLTENVVELSYVDLQRIDDSPQGHALRRYQKGHYLGELSDDAIEALLQSRTDAAIGALPTSACRRMAVRSRTCPIRTPRLPSAVPPSSTSPRAGGPTRPKTIDAWRSRGGRPRLSTRSPEASTSIHSATKAPRASVACIHRTSSRG